MSNDTTKQSIRLTLSLLAGLIAIVWATALIVGNIRSGYEYERNISSSWTLADKSSTIKAKSDYINRFVAALDASGLKGQHSAILFPTPDNDFDLNMNALRTLQARLIEIQSIDPNSFAYQTAMQQITAQEQGEAEPMLNVFESTWYKQNHFLLWGWVQGIQWILLISSAILSVVLLWIFFDERGVLY